MTELEKRVDFWFPYLDVATFYARRRVKRLMLTTNAEAIHTMRAVLLIGRDCYMSKQPITKAMAWNLLDSYVRTLDQFDVPMEEDISGLIDMHHFREYIICGIRVLDIS